MFYNITSNATITKTVSSRICRLLTNICNRRLSKHHRIARVHRQSEGTSKACDQDVSKSGRKVPKGNRRRLAQDCSCPSYWCWLCKHLKNILIGSSFATRCVIFLPVCCSITMRCLCFGAVDSMENQLYQSKKSELVWYCFLINS